MVATLIELAAAEKINSSSVWWLLRLALLAQDVVEAFADSKTNTPACAHPSVPRTARLAIRRLRSNCRAMANITA